MAIVFETYSMDYTSIQHRAQNKAGKWFTRSQYRDPRYGYKWTAWKPLGYEWKPDRTGREMSVRLPA